MLAPANEQVEAGRIANRAIKLAQKLCAQAIDGKNLDKEIEQFILDSGGRPALKGYHPPFALKPYEWTICLAIDKDVVHGVPIKLVGPNNLITVDLVVEYQGWFADTARTFTASTDHIKKSFCNMSMAIFQAGLDIIAPNQSMNLFAETISLGIGMNGYGIVREYCGHGIGKAIHCEPQVINYPDRNNNTFEVGKSYAVEPVISIDPTYSLRYEPNDGYSVRANCLVTHNEDTIFVGPKNIINLTGNLE